MATKRFCDICDTLLSAIDDQPLIRILKYDGSDSKDRTEYRIAKASVMITNQHDHAMTDVCVRCKLLIINTGEHSPVATLQVSPDLYRKPDIQLPPPIIPMRPEPTPVFEPSLKATPVTPVPSAPISVGSSSELEDEKT